MQNFMKGDGTDGTNGTYGIKAARWVVLVGLIGVAAATVTVTRVSQYPNVSTVRTNDLIVLSQPDLGTNANIRWEQLQAQIQAMVSSNVEAQVAAASNGWITAVISNAVFAGQTVFQGSGSNYFGGDTYIPSLMGIQIMNGLRVDWVTNQYLGPEGVTNTEIYLGFR